jgi:hypothetical protein
MHRRYLRWLVRALAPALFLVVPAAAQGAGAPAATTGGSTMVTAQSARVVGSVDPNGLSTTYQVQYGTTVAYGMVTPQQTVSGNGRKAITFDVSGLAPATVYHYRLIAQNSKGLSRGRDRAFKTKVQPLGVSFAASPNPIMVGSTTTISGTLTGTGNGERQVILETNPFPYTQGFKQSGNAIVTDAAGNFNFGLQPVAANTQYRVSLPDKPSVVSPIVVVSVTPRVSTKLGTTRVRKGSKLTFAGTVSPALDGTPIAIQKLNGSRWVTVAGTVARHSSSGASTYSKRITIRRGGRYRVYVGVANGSFVPTTGREVVIHAR